MSRTLKAHARRRQRGAAALIVVLVLFFVVSLVAAYTSRGMIFEQRTSTNQMRSTQALEVGDAGVEWAITKLNAGLVDASCAPAAGGTSTFRQRYLTFAANGNIDGVTTANATCVMQPSSGWVCSCPAAGSTMPTSGDGPFPAFRVYFAPDKGGTRTNLIRVTVSACTDASANCLADPQVPDPGKGSASVSASLGLKGAIDTLPAAAVTLPAPSTAVASLTLSGGAQLTAYNGAQAGTGIAVQAGGTLPPAGLTLGGAPGMPAEMAKIEGDVSLVTGAGGGLRDSSDAGACPAGDANLGCSFNRAFTAVFGAARAVYEQQPGLVRCTSSCDAAALAALAAKNPRSVILVEDDATIDANIGSAADPVALILKKTLTISGGAVVTGLVYTATGSWTVSGTPRIDGAIVSEVPVILSGGVGDTLEVRYNLTALTKLRSEFGSFARVPGGWRDFPSP